MKIIVCGSIPTNNPKPKDSTFSIVKDEKKTQIVTFKRLMLANV